jgi:hypothetical protein
MRYLSSGQVKSLNFEKKTPYKMRYLSNRDIFVIL